MGTVKKCLNGVTSKEGNIFYTVKGRGVSRSSRKFRLMAIFDSGTLSQVFFISEARHSYIRRVLGPFGSYRHTWDFVKYGCDS